MIKKELRDFIYSYKSVLTVFIAIIGEKLILHANHLESYNIFFHSWLITPALQQFVYDSFKTDIREKGLFFYQNLKIPFKMYFFSKFIICVFLFFIMFLFEIKNIMMESNFLQFLCLSMQSFISMPIMFIASVLLKQSETGGLILSTIIMGVIIFGLMNLPYLWLNFIITFLLLILFIFIAYKLYKSYLFRRCI